MANEFEKLRGDYRRTGKETLGSMARSAANFRRSLQGMSMEMAEFSKRSVNQAIEAQAELTKRAFSAYFSELSKFAAMGLYAPFFDRNEGPAPRNEARRRADRGRATGTASTSTSRQGRNKNGSTRPRQQSAAQRANTHRKTGPAKRRSRKAKG
jgi:hypothetical protein